MSTEQVRITHYECEDFKVEGELVKGLYFLHLQVYNYSHNVQKKLDLLFEEMKTAAKRVGFTDTFYAALEDQRFARYMGGTKIKETVVDDKTLGVFKWDLM